MAVGDKDSDREGISVTLFAKTDTGMQRPGNEDSFIVADLTSGTSGLGSEVSTHTIGDRGSLMVVSDGMGGAAAGEVASEMAVNAICEALMKAPPDDDICKKLNTAVETANEQIWNHAKQNVQLSGMGATLTAVLLSAQYAYIAQVGDSRAYLVRGDRIKQLTKDQSLVQLLLESGAIEPDQAASVPHNVIMQALGTSPTVSAAMCVTELRKNDLLILCSDGLSNKLTDDEIREIASQSGSLSEACQRMIELANDRGGEDNITVVIAKFDGERLHSATQRDSITGTLKVLDKGCFGGDISSIGGSLKALAGLPEKEDPKVTTLTLNRLDLQEIPDTAPALASWEPAVSQSEHPGRSFGKLNFVLVILAALLLSVAGYLVLHHFLKAGR